MTEYYKSLIRTSEKAYFTCIILCGIVSGLILSISDKSFVVRDGAKTSVFLYFDLPALASIWILPLLITITYLYYIYYLFFAFDQYQLHLKKKRELNEHESINESILQHCFQIMVETNRSNICWIKLIIYYFGLFPLPVFTIFVLWLACLKKHSLILTSFHSLLFWISVCSFLYFIKKKDIMMSPKKISKKSLALLTIILLIMIFTPQYSIFNGKNYELPEIKIDNTQNWKNNTNIANYLLFKAGINPFITFRTGQISAVNEVNKDDSDKKSVDNITGADLHGAQLQGANAERAFFVRSDLRKANLRGSYLRGADFSYADLRYSDLTGAYIRLANFKNADLRSVTFNDVEVIDSEDPTRIIGANFQGAKFDHLEIVKNKRFFPISLLKNDFDHSNKNSKNIISQMFSSKNLSLAFYGIKSNEEWDALMLKLKCYLLEEAGQANDEIKYSDESFYLAKPYIKDEDLRNKKLICKKFSSNYSLEEADFSYFDLSNTKFVNVKLKNAIFNETNLIRTDFTGADLREAKFTGVLFHNIMFDVATDFTGATFKDCDVCCKLGCSFCGTDNEMEKKDRDDELRLIMSPATK